MNGLRPYRRDAGLPARAGEPALAPLPPAGVAALVREHLLVPGAADLSGITWTYARWKPHRSLACGYDVRLSDGTTRCVHVKRYVGDKAAHLVGREAGDAADAWIDPLLRPGVTLPEQNMAITVHPADRELPGLVRLQDMRRTTRWINTGALHGGARMRASRSRLSLLRYRPEARAVHCLEAAWTAPGGRHGSTRHALRVLPPGQARRVAAARAACAAGSLVPRLQLVQERTGLLLEEWLDVDVAAPDALQHAARAGQALARLHAVAGVTTDAAVHAPREPAADRNGLFAWHPQLAALSGQLVETAPAGAVVWCHGDFHPDQVAFERRSGEVRLLDLDRLGPGPAASDLASWIADHFAERPDATLDEAAGELLNGYVAAGGERPDPVALASHVTHALVARAAACLRRLEDGAVRRSERLLRRAQAVARTARIPRADSAGSRA